MKGIAYDVLTGVQMDAANSSSSSAASPAPKAQQVGTTAAEQHSLNVRTADPLVIIICKVLLPLKPELLPSVLRTSADLAHGGKAAQAATPGEGACLADQ